MIIRPVDLPRIRNSVVGCLSSGCEKSIGDGLSRHLQWKGHDLSGAIAKEEAGRLRSAELFFASDEMTMLADVASATLPPFSLLPEDLPSPSGLLVLEAPFGAADDEPSGSVMAVSWGPSTAGGELIVNADVPAGELWVSWYFGDEKDLPHLTLTEACHLRFGTEEIDGALGATSGDQEIRLEDERGPGRWMRALKTAWVLMQQPIAQVADAEYKRHDRRRLERQNINADRVRVITLRRAKSEGSGDSDREYHHQWIVRGHWRQQWYPSRGVHRPVWIAPHVKGPKGAPLLGGEKVHAWVR